METNRKFVINRKSHKIVNVKLPFVVRNRSAAVTVLLGICLMLSSLANGSSETPVLNVWANKAPASLVIQQVAELGGRELDAAEPLEGTLTGQFSGTVVEALGEIADQVPVVFDMDKSTLSVMGAHEKKVSSIVSGDNRLDDAMRTELTSNLMPGNEVVFHENEVIVSGHPNFVKRTAQVITGALADIETNRPDAEKPISNRATELSKVVPLPGDYDYSADQIEAAAQKPLEATVAAPAEDVPVAPVTNTVAGGNTEEVIDSASEVIAREIEESTSNVPDEKVVVEVSQSIMQNGEQAVVSDTGRAVIESDAEQSADVKPTLVESPEDNGAVADQTTVAADPAESGVSEQIQIPGSESESSAAPTSTREYQWVTDIPGFDTF